MIFKTDFIKKKYLIQKAFKKLFDITIMKPVHTNQTVLEEDMRIFKYDSHFICYTTSVISMVESILKKCRTVKKSFIVMQCISDPADHGANGLGNQMYTIANNAVLSQMEINE